MICDNATENCIRKNIHRQKKEKKKPPAQISPLLTRRNKIYPRETARKIREAKRAGEIYGSMDKLYTRVKIRHAHLHSED